MAILIKGMEMPENCFSCNFAVDGCCLAMRPIRTRDWKAKETTNYCPLVEVPEPKRVMSKDEMEAAGFET